MTDESTFQYCLVVLTGLIYLVRAVCARRAHQGHGTLHAPPLVSTGIMFLWFASLLGYGLGFAAFQFHLPVPNVLRWFGFAFMALALPLSLWLWAFDLIGEFISSRVSLGGQWLEDFGPHQLSLNPVFGTFVLCDIGAMLLAANGYVLITGLMALAAMGVWVKRDFAQAA